ncbi:potassium transporter KefB [Spirosoma endbachense]|uniref:Potassium transporter KefB n=1 Tax=Spirosoma endbachense TaxID=2666025 RepID=A0A6P1VRP3_9BACT|nr:potassium transporter KefB [Spirosoma endbachense]QHV95294.1 potassium transporter KefB [Spirosoma endbachense]
MTQRTKLTTPTIHSASVGKRMIQGAAIALILIALFLLPVSEPDPAWGKLWMIKPLLIVPVAGAIGGAIYYLLDHLRYQGGWKKTLAYPLSLIGYIIVLWLGTVLGLNGTLWN